jgi:RNA polymerase sigma-70 factor (ECF subfamily)
MHAPSAVDQAARASYSRLLAFLAARSCDVAAAEDALADAFRAALESWPHSGVPDKPEAWLLTAARRRLLDGIRHARVHGEAVPTLLALADEAQKIATNEVAFPDERLKLLFVCAHPAIDARAHTPLMLQVVLGLDAARIASACLVPPAAVSQRLTRAKAKIRDACIAFELPEAIELSPRVGAVLEAIYAAYGRGWDDVAGADPRRKGLSMEAIELGRLLVQLLPTEPEAQGLLALMLHCEARREARRTPRGAYVPLSEQDARRWSLPMIEEAENVLAKAAESGRIGRFQLEAAIQSAHARRRITNVTDWQAIAQLYEGLARLAPTIGALVGRAAATGEAQGAVAGWQLLDSIAKDAVTNYQPYWAVAAHLLKRMGQSDQAAAAYQKAIGLCEDPAMRTFLMERSGQVLR